MHPTRTLLVIAFFLLSHPAKAQSDCNIKINPERIRFNTALDFFIKRLKTDSFRVSEDKRQIPAFIKETIDCYLDTLANPDEEWAATCTRREGLPFTNYYSTRSMLRKTFLSLRIGPVASALISPLYSCN